METRSFCIVASNKSNVEYQIAKLNKRAKKLGLEEITYVFGKAYIEKRSVLTSNVEFPDMPPEYKDKNLLVIPVEITGPLVVAYSGWRFVAAITHLGEENLIRCIADIEVPKKYRTIASNCDHCKVSRRRNDTYVLIKEGEFVQVGSTCIKDFLGSNSPDAILSQAEFISDLISYLTACDEEGFGGGGGGNYFHIETFLSKTNAVIRNHGWLSKTKADEIGGVATARHVENNLFHMVGGTSATQKYSEVLDSDKEKAAKIIEWAENLSDEECSSDYMFNVRAIVRSGMVGIKFFGYAASIVAAYDRMIADLEEKPNSNWVGELKKRMVFELELKKEFVYESMYGMNSKFIFSDCSGNVFVWVTSKRSLEVGKKYKVKGTIKQHSEYKGVKQTVLTRCDILEG